MTADFLSAPSPEEPDDTTVTPLFPQLSSDELEWQDLAICAQTDPESFFPEKGGSTREAKAICQDCQVKANCLDYALRMDERFGIWGGHSERERRRLRQRGYQVSEVALERFKSLELIPLTESPHTAAIDRQSQQRRPVVATAPEINPALSRATQPAPARPHAVATVVTAETERQSEMKDELRFPAVRAFLEERLGQSYIIGGSSKATFPHQLKVDAKLDGTDDLRRVVRKMGRTQPDIKVSEASDGTILVELIKQPDEEVAPVIQPPAPIVADFSDEPVQGEDESINDFVGRQLREEFEAELAEEAAARQAALEQPKPIEQAAAVVEVETVAAEVEEVAAVVTEATIEPISLADILANFVEMEAPEGYEPPVVSRNSGMTANPERLKAALTILARKPGQRIFGKGITPEVAGALGLKNIQSTATMISAIVADDYIGRVLNGKLTTVMWLRQKGADWLQAYERGEFAPAPTVTELVVAETPQPKIINPPVSQAYDEYAELSDWEGEGGASSDILPSAPRRMEIQRRTNELELAHEFKLDIHALTKCYAILGQRGSGKTSTGVVMAEEMIAQGWPVAIIDPQGVWYGLKSSADGMSAGLPVIIFGGSHGDVPLYETDGHLLAELMETGDCSIIIDTSEMFDDEAMQSLMTDFFTGLYHRRRRLPMHLIVDEADEIVPQAGFSKELVMAATRLTKRGRTRGIGSSWISQRPQDLNKKVLTQAEVLLAMRLMHQLDIKAIEEWIGKNADVSESNRIRSTLASLPTGTGWFWSPAWMGDMQRINVRKRLTFDTSGTPLPGQFAPEPEVVAYVDLSILPEEFLTRLRRRESSSTERYEVALETIRNMAPKELESKEIEQDLDEDDDLEDAPAAIEEVIAPTIPVAPVSLLTDSEVAELIRLRAQIGAMTQVMTDALRQRDDAHAELNDLHAEARSAISELKERITLLETEHAVKLAKADQRVRELREQVIAREHEVARLEAHLSRNGLIVYPTLHVVESGENAG